MNMRDLIPWGRETNNSQAPVPYRGGGMSPFFTLRRDIDRLFDDMFRMPALTGSGTMSWPSVEVTDGDREIRVSVEIPGMNEDDVELTVQEGGRTIRGEKKSKTEDKDRGYSERWYGRFERRIGLPEGVEDENAEAVFRNGVLTITMPKSADAKSGRRIPISTETKH